MIFIDTRFILTHETCDKTISGFLSLRKTVGNVISTKASRTPYWSFGLIRHYFIKSTSVYITTEKNRAFVFT
jgi:hypothetical protein